MNKAWSLLKDELRPQSRDAVADKGLIRPSPDGDFELSTIGDAECVFVQFTDSGTAVCSIQKAFYEGRIQWPKPISCHLFLLTPQLEDAFENERNRWMDEPK